MNLSLKEGDGMAQATLLGYPRQGPQRELKFALEAFWRDALPVQSLERIAANVRASGWKAQKKAGIDLLPSNDFSLYDHVLDMSFAFGVVPERCAASSDAQDLQTYFAMARGTENARACEMTKWFDTNYHYIVPELSKKTVFQLNIQKPVQEYLEARALGFETRPVLVGPISYLLLGKDRDGDHPLDKLDAFLEVYGQALRALEKAGASWVQLDEPFLVTDLDEKTQNAYCAAYTLLRRSCGLKFLVTTPFGFLGDTAHLALSLPIDALHVDLVRAPDQIEDILKACPEKLVLALGIVDGRNVWRNNLERSLQILERAATKIGNDRIWVSSSCSLMHAPYDLDLEPAMDSMLRSWLAFSVQKLNEIAALTRGLNEGRKSIVDALLSSSKAVESRKIAPIIKEKAVRERMSEQPLSSTGRTTPREQRRLKQKEALDLPLFPTTTIGSFPQTDAVRQKRAALRKGALSLKNYDTFIHEIVAECVSFQESLGLDVLVHGEFERADMVEFFARKMKGFAFTENGWVQSYGSRVVKPPILYGDVLRPEPMTIPLTCYAQSLTKKPVKGILTGPVTILQWSFVRDDQPRSATAHQIALALQDEVLELENAGIRIIQIDEPAFREAAPLRLAGRRTYFDWATKAFKLACTGVKDETQIHTHMCYSAFNDIISFISDLDADVVSIETSRSHMELLGAFVASKYPGEIGPGVYDIHSPRVPDVQEILALLAMARENLEDWQIWVNPDCGLKTRNWFEISASLEHMVEAARTLRATIKTP